MEQVEQPDGPRGRIPKWIELTDDPKTWPMDEQYVIYWFAPFSCAWVGQFIRDDETVPMERGRPGTFASLGGWCDMYDVTHWHPVEGVKPLFEAYKREKNSKKP